MDREISQQFESVRIRFGHMDVRFGHTENRFGYIENRFERIENRLRRLEEVVHRVQITMEGLRGDIQRQGQGEDPLELLLEKYGRKPYSSI